MFVVLMLYIVVVGVAMSVNNSLYGGPVEKYGTEAQKVSEEYMYVCYYCVH